MSGRTRERNQARLVRCSAGCGALVWLAGALPTTSDESFVCSSCSAADLRARAQLIEEHPDDFHRLQGEEAVKETSRRGRRR